MDSSQIPDPNESKYLSGSQIALPSWVKGDCKDEGNRNTMSRTKQRKKWDLKAAKQYWSNNQFCTHYPEHAFRKSTISLPSSPGSARVGLHFNSPNLSMDNILNPACLGSFGEFFPLFQKSKSQTLQKIKFTSDESVKSMQVCIDDYLKLKEQLIQREEECKQLKIILRKKEDEICLLRKGENISPPTPTHEKEQFRQTTYIQRPPPREKKLFRQTTFSLAKEKVSSYYHYKSPPAPPREEKLFRQTTFSLAKEKVSSDYHYKSPPAPPREEKLFRQTTFSLAKEKVSSDYHYKSPPAPPREEKLFRQTTYILAKEKFQGGRYKSHSNVSSQLAKKAAIMRKERAEVKRHLNRLNETTLRTSRYNETTLRPFATINPLCTLVATMKPLYTIIATMKPH